MLKPTILAAALCASTAITLTANVAEACGGLFCDGGGPGASPTVNQAAERIIFMDHPDGTVTAVVQVLYDGPADRFGWLLPVPGVPEVGLSSDVAFTRLQAATNPQYNLNQRTEGECGFLSSTNNGAAFNNGTTNSAGFSPNNGTNGGGVNVLARGNTGPYDYVVIQVDGANDKTQLALDWLEENAYAVGDVGPDLIADYLDDGFNLLAIRLQKTQDTGSIRPIRLRYESDHPMIPIKLTAVAANADMGVMTWVLGPERAIPLNYKSLVLNDALINWFNPGLNYDDVVIAAANEASGQGFVTEYAQASTGLGSTIWTRADETVWEYIETGDWDSLPLGELFELSILSLSTSGATSGFGTNGGFANRTPYDGLDQVIDLTFPDLTAAGRQRLLDDPRSFPDDTEFPSDFAPQSWIDAMKEFVIDPMIETQELFWDSAYTTRLYTTMSANEMTIDPSFDFNPKLNDVSNMHEADYVIECSPAYLPWTAPFRVELPSGLVVRGRNQGNWPVSPGPMMPFTLLVSQETTDGDGEVVRDNYDMVKQLLDEANARVPGGTGVGADDGFDIDGDGDVDWDDDINGDGIVDERDRRQDSKGGGGCSVAGGSASLVSLPLVGLLWMRRRRRRE